LRTKANRLNSRQRIENKSMYLNKRKLQPVLVPLAKVNHVGSIKGDLAPIRLVVVEENGSSLRVARRDLKHNTRSCLHDNAGGPDLDEERVELVGLEEGDIGRGVVAVREVRAVARRGGVDGAKRGAKPALDERDGVTCGSFECDVVEEESRGEMK
jgi:hypothetical protein